MEEDILAIREIGSFRVVLKRSRNFRRMLDSPIDFLFFSLIILQRVSSAFVGFIKRCDCLGYLNT